jgi:hypothetical protein
MNGAARHGRPPRSGGAGGRWTSAEPARAGGPPSTRRGLRQAFPSGVGPRRPVADSRPSKARSPSAYARTTERHATCALRSRTAAASRGGSRWSSCRASIRTPWTGHIRRARDRRSARGRDAGSMEGRDRPLPRLDHRTAPRATRYAAAAMDRPEAGARHPMIDPPEEVSKPDSVLPLRKREQQPFVLPPGCPGSRATDPRERTGRPRPAFRPDLPPTRSCSGWGLPSVRPHERTW